MTETDHSPARRDCERFSGYQCVATCCPGPQIIGACPGCLKRTCACPVDEAAMREFLRGLTTPPGEKS